MAKYSHKIHQYNKIYPGMFNTGRPVWGCALPDCTHFMPHNVAGSVVGKMSLCNSCMEIMMLDHENMKRDKPICNKCAHPDRVIEIPEEFDFERYEAKSFIAKKESRDIESITEDEITRMVQLRRIQGDK